MTQEQVENGWRCVDLAGNDLFHKDYYNVEIIQITSVDSLNQNNYLLSKAKERGEWSVDLIYGNDPENPGCIIHHDLASKKMDKL